MGYNFGPQSSEKDPDIYRDADIPGTFKKMGQSLGSGIYNALHGSKPALTPLDQGPTPNTTGSVRNKMAPQMYNNNAYEQRPNLDNVVFPDPALQDPNKLMQEPGTPGAYFGQPEDLATQGASPYEDTTPGEQMRPGEVDNVGGTQFNRSIRSGGNVRYDDGRGNYMEGPRQAGLGQGNVSYTSMFSDALKAQQAKEAEAAAAPQEPQRSSVRSRIDALQKQLDKSRSIFDRRGHTLQEYRKAAALRKDLRQQIADLQGVEQQEMRGQQAMDLANLQGQYGLQEAGIRSANQGQLTQKDILKMQQDQANKDRDFNYQVAKDTEAKKTADAEAATAQDARKQAEYEKLSESVASYFDPATTPEQRAAIASGLESAMRSQLGDVAAKIQNGQQLTPEEYQRVMQNPLTQQFMTLSQRIMAEQANDNNWIDLWGKSEDVPGAVTSDPYQLQNWYANDGMYQFTPPDRFKDEFTTAEFKAKNAPEGTAGMMDLAMLFGQMMRNQSRIPVRQGQ